MTSLEFDGRARRARAAPAARESTPANQSALAFALGDRGRPLDAATRAPFEVGFGRDLSGVRVHDDARAARAASSLGADAFAVGADVYFGRNRYDAASRDGRRLLAHELGHVVQGTRGERALSTFADEAARVVTSAADRVVTGRRAEPLAPAAAAVLRQEHGAAHERRTPHTLAELERGGDGRIRRPDDGHTY